MAEVGLFRRVAPALVLAAAGGLLLYLLPSGGESETGAEDLGSPEGDAFPSDSASAGTAPTSQASPGATASAAGSPSASAKRVIQGDAVNFRYGVVQVKVLLEGTRIANIAVLDAPGGGYQQYTDRAIPGMKAEILAAQSTRVAAVSGATYTSDAYAQSVQSALDKA